MSSNSIYKRYTSGLVSKLENDESAWVFVFNSNKILIKTDGDTVSIPSIKDFGIINIIFSNKQYLGELDGHPCYCMETDENTNFPKGMALKDLRSLLGFFDDDIFLLIGRAFQIMNWNRMNKYCGRCGSLTENKKDERAKVCPNCGSVFYPRISPAVITAIIKGDQILLAHNNNFVKNRYSVIAGFVEPGETFEDCVKREIMEEVGIKVKNIKYFGSQPWPFPDSLMIGFTAEYESGEIKVDGVEIGDAGWYKKDDLPQVPAKTSIAGRLIEWFVQKDL